jgi:hypothetical protein
VGNRQFTNEASALLAATMSPTSTTIQLAAGFGQYFPSPTGTEYFIVAAQDTSGDIEYIAITGRSTDNLTVAPTSSQFPSGGRAQEGTTAQSFTANLARIELRETAGLLADLYQKDGDTLTGPMNLGGQTVTNGVLSGSQLSIENAEEIVNTPLRGATGQTGNQITVPTDGVSRAQAGGLNILCQGDPLPAFTVGMILMFNGSPTNLPSGWNVCDGTNGTPDLRNSFIIGAGLAYPLGTNGNIAITSAVESPALTPTINGTALTTAQLAAHAHPFDYWFGNSSAVIGIPGFANPGFYFAGDSGTGERISFAGTTEGSGATHTHTAATLPDHTHVVEVGPFYALYFAMYIG